MSWVSKLGKYINPKAIEKVAKEGDELLNMKYIGDGAKILSKDSDEVLSKAIKELPSNMDEAAKARFVKGIGEFGNGVSKIEWEDVVSKGTKSVDNIKLSTGGMKIKLAGSQGSDTASKVISFENFHKRGAELIKTEGEIAWKNIKGLATPVDHLIKINDQKVGVSVKRLIQYSGPNQVPLTEGEVNRILVDGFKGLDEGLQNVFPQDIWDKSVLQIFYGIAPSR